MTTKPRGGGAKALVVGPLKKTFFLRLPPTTLTEGNEGIQPTVKRKGFLLSI